MIDLAVTLLDRISRIDRAVSAWYDSSCLHCGDCLWLSSPATASMAGRSLLCRFLISHALWCTRDPAGCLVVGAPQGRLVAGTSTVQGGAS
jgi:hypothetical protein